jgi:hypothetical protein
MCIRTCVCQIGRSWHARIIPQPKNSSPGPRENVSRERLQNVSFVLSGCLSVQVARRGPVAHGGAPAARVAGPCFHARALNARGVATARGGQIANTEQGTGPFKIFGAEDETGYLDKYSIKESITDETTLPISTSSHRARWSCRSIGSTRSSLNSPLPRA